MARGTKGTNEFKSNTPVWLKDEAFLGQPVTTSRPLQNPNLRLLIPKCWGFGACHCSSFFFFFLFVF